MLNNIKSLLKYFNKDFVRVKLMCGCEVWVCDADADVEVSVLLVCYS